MGKKDFTTEGTVSIEERDLEAIIESPRSQPPAVIYLFSEPPPEISSLVASLFPPLVFPALS